jgi:amino acid adenylation domain-containing protein
MTLLAAFDVLLWRYTGQDDIVVGTPIAGRNRAEIENLIGFFVNTLVLRSDLSGDPTFLELLKRVRETALGAYAHQDLPFEKLVEELQPERSLSHHPLFQVMFVLQNAPLGEVKLPGLSLSPLGNERPVAKFDLNLHFGETEDGLVGHLYYNRDLFDASTAEQIVSHYKNLLQAVAMSPEARLSRLPLMSDAEREQVVVAWNRTEADYPLSRGIHRLFEEQAEKIPDAPALVFEDERLDYRELNERANRLAHHLSALGVGPETLVGIYLERSVEMVVSLLAILKAGGAYLGLDPTQPAERVAFMMEDARVRAVITNSALRDSLPGHHASVVSLDEEAEQIAARPATNIKVEVWPESLAYVIYTSGSTGRPKGVIGGHRQLLNYLYGITERLRLQPRGSFAMHQTLSVDAPITYLFAALCRGGVLHIISEERAADGDALGDYFRLHDIDYFKVAPSHLAALQASRQPERIMPGRLLLIGGEAARPEWVEAARALAPDCVIVNHYGPTETTVGVLTYQANGTNGAHATPILPLGRPLGNAEIYILDADLNPVPVGVPGELHIGGVGLARGYLNRPELTAERFIPHPFGRSGMRLYKSGDLARFLPDGTVEFLGRLDHQVKVRGFRVELEEIEAVLSEHPRVRAVAVLAHEQAAGDNRLYAYAVLDGELTTDELRWFAQERLPEHMVPSAFMLLDELPRTPQGKIDRRALPSPEQFRREPGEEFVAPRTPTEEKVAEMWSELLGVERVGVNDNFFELGGHSLLATQLVSRLRQTFRIELPLRALFETPTVAATATAVDALTERPEAMAAAAISPLSRNARRVKQSELKEEVR